MWQVLVRRWHRTVEVRFNERRDDHDHHPQRPAARRQGGTMTTMRKVLRLRTFRSAASLNQEGNQP